jgi:hypothetical protein
MQLPLLKIFTWFLPENNVNCISEILRIAIFEKILK